ncbi:MAG: transcriptional repressor [Bacteroidetes bacterium]|nr:transcriptional repressor [Bacteroidota bacterium]
MHINIQTVSEQLKAYQIRPSYQRVRILAYVQTEKNHPTIDMIYSSLITEIPSLSKTTIYNTLKLFVDAGIMQPVTIEDHEIRYDADTAPHIHFKCIECGEVTDVFIPEQQDWLPSHIPAGYDVREQHLYARGLCPGCHA